MSRIYVCNSYCDSVSVINCDTFKEVKRISLKDLKERVGPHGICKYKENILTANKYSNDISFINTDHYNIDNYFIGNSCSDIKVIGDMAYISCSDSNDIKVFDLIYHKIDFRIPCGNCPKSICVMEESHILAVNNFMDNSISIIDYLNYENKRDIFVGGYPSKVAYCKDLNLYIVLVSLIGKNKNGYLKILDGNFKDKCHINVGRSPLDVCIYDNKAYVSNFEDGTVSIIDLITLTEVGKIRICGMPRGMLLEGNNLYIADYYGNCLYKIELDSLQKKKIDIGKEPVSMIIS